MSARNSRPELVQTQRCRNGDDFCRFHALGDCWFAHSDAELRCALYARIGICPLMPNCTRRHVLVDVPPDSNNLIMGTGRSPYQADVRYAPLALYPLPVSFKKFVPLGPLDVRQKRVDAVIHFRNAFQHDCVSHKLLSQGTFRSILHDMQQVEELFGMIDLVSYKLEGTRFDRRDLVQSDLFALKVAGLAENRPSVLRGDNVHVFVHVTREWLCGIVHFVNVDELVVSMPPHFYNLPNLNSLLIDVCFTITRTQERVRHSAIDHGIFFDIPTCSALTTVAGIERDGAAVVHPKGLNDEQRRLIEMVTARQASRAALLWGPPGTGKTTTVVAALAETLVLVPGAKILVCTPSNEAADVVIERLLHYRRVSNQCAPLLAALDPKRLIRVNGMMRQEKLVPKEIVQHSFTDGSGGFRLPTCADVVAAQVVVCTLMTSSKLRAIGVPTDHFTHLFVDEAGHATEADFMIPTMVCEKAARCVLAGDHKQLGALVRAPPAITAGMGISPLERLMNTPELASQHVMLTHNYRSAEAIVHLVNAVYDDKLVSTRLAQAKNYEVWVSNGVIKIDHPLLFLHHKSPESRENDSPSWQNLREAHLLVDIALQLWKDFKISAKDIVFLSPYRKQVKKIEGILFDRLRGDPSVERDARDRPIVPFKVSTVEAFQGRESRVVLLSCVRNEQEDKVPTDIRFGIGFLKQPQRANVAMSRAQDLMIIAGNAQLLYKDELWRKYLERLIGMPRGTVVDVTAGTPNPMSAFPQQWSSAPLGDQQPAAVEDNVDHVTSANEERSFERHL